MTETPPPLVEVHPDADTLATAVAGELLNRIADAQAAGHVPNVGLTGGTIADAVHREIARLAPASGVDWGAVVLWFGDIRAEGESMDVPSMGSASSRSRGAVSSNVGAGPPVWARSQPSCRPARRAFSMSSAWI